MSANRCTSCGSWVLEKRTVPPEDGKGGDRGAPSRGPRTLVAVMGLVTVLALAGLVATVMHGGRDASHASSAARSGDGSQSGEAPSAPGGPSATSPGRSTSASSGAKDTWTRYVNPRFGFHIAVPPRWEAGPEPADGDGRVFVAPGHSTTLTVFGTNTVGSACGTSQGDVTGPALVRQCLKAAARELRTKGVSVSYQAEGSNWFVVSGVGADGVIRYQRSYVGSGATVTMQLRYPAAEKTAMDAQVTTMSRSLEPGDLAIAH